MESKDNGSQLVFKGIRFDVRSIQVKAPNGKVVKREYVVHPGAVVILPLVDKEHVIMIRNQRFAVKKNLWELPAGTLEPNEPPHDTASRELLEETGYHAAKIELLTTFYTSPGICNEIMWAYLAQDLTLHGQQLDEGEEIQTEILPWRQVLKMVQDGTICDGKTIAALLYYHTFVAT